MALRRILKGAALALPILACDGGTGPDDILQPCGQMAEFGNYGCAEIQGTVKNPDGVPLPGINVHPSFLEGQDCCVGGVVGTDCEGNYTFRVYWFGLFDLPDPDFTPDTLTLYVKASQRPDGSSDTVRIKDSILIQVRFAPVGEPPPVHVVNLLLPIERRWPNCG